MKKYVQATLQKEYGLVMNENSRLKEDVQRLQTDLSSAMDRIDAHIKERQSHQRHKQPEVRIQSCIYCQQLLWQLGAAVFIQQDSALTLTMCYRSAREHSIPGQENQDLFSYLKCLGF